MIGDYSLAHGSSRPFGTLGEIEDPPAPRTAAMLPDADEGQSAFSTTSVEDV